MRCSIRWIRSVGRVLSDASGRTRFTGVNTDVTDRKLAEEALLQTEKLAAVGRLASVISHEINNPLEAVTNLLYIVRSSEHLSPQDKDYLELADRELARVAPITAQTLRFHRNVATAGPVDVNRMVQELLALYQTRLTSSKIDVRLDLGERVLLQAVEGDIRQVLNNLVSNAFDVMRNGGVLRLRTSCARHPVTGSNGAIILVSDNGCGIPEALRNRIFDAFYSTKGINGAGLGLWISKRIVHKHKGHLAYRSCNGTKHGTTFRLWLPEQIGESAAEGLAQSGAGLVSVSRRDVA